MKNNIVRLFAAALLAVAASFATVSAQENLNNEFPGIRIENFGKMDDHLYRGAQPEKDDYAALAKLGINTIVDLRNDPTDYERSSAEAAGMKYVNIPMSGWKYADDKDVDHFMKLMNDPETGVVYVHCKAGKHRTGLVGAVYRFNKYGWDYDQAYKEMKKFNYTSWPVHFNIKSYVKDYSEKLVKTRAAAAAGAHASATAN